MGTDGTGNKDKPRGRSRSHGRGRPPKKSVSPAIFPRGNEKSKSPARQGDSHYRLRLKSPERALTSGGAKAPNMRGSVGSARVPVKPGDRWLDLCNMSSAAGRLELDPNNLFEVEYTDERGDSRGNLLLGLHSVLEQGGTGTLVRARLEAAQDPEVGGMLAESATWVRGCSRHWQRQCCYG